jgi:hypothetical protein
MKNFLKNWFNKKVILSEKEKVVLDTLDLLLTNEHTDVVIREFTKDYVVTNKNLHYDILITNQVVAVVNTESSSTTCFTSHFLDLCKSKAAERVERDFENRLREMSERELGIMRRIINKLKDIEKYGKQQRIEGF